MRESSGKCNFENEESWKKIKENFDNKNFSFETVSKRDVSDLMEDLSGNNPTISNDIQVSRNMFLLIMKN